MKKLIFISAALLVTFTKVVSAQEDFHNNTGKGSETEENERKHPATFKSKTGMVFNEGDYIVFGDGTLPTGDFATISVNGTSMFRTVSSNNAYNANSNSLSKDWHGYKKKIIRFDVQGRENIGYRTFAIITIGAARYQVDIDKAIDKGEIIVPEQYRPKNATGTVVQEQSTADEILKYKKLLDDGVITKEEFDIQKKKLLSK